MPAPVIEWRAEPVDGVVDPEGHRVDVGRRKPPEKHGATMPIDAPGSSSGALSGKAVYLSQCHGWIWYDTLDSFSTQRGNVWDTVEDFHNPEAMNQILAAYLENAGASVYTSKERDHNPLMVIVDDGDAAYAETGTGFSDGAAGFADWGTWAYDENPFQGGTTRTFASNGGGIATWTPAVELPGYYALYVSWETNAENAKDAHYRITHAGGVIDRTFDQRVHGSTWQYVETLWVEDSVKVELIGDSPHAAQLSADAVRIGGGTGVIERHGGTTGRPRWEEGAILAAQFNGAPSEVYDPYYDGNGSDPSARSVWAAWEHPDGEDAVYLSWHSNAFDGTARGTGVYTYEASCTSGPPVDGSEDFSALLQEELVDVGYFWDSTWKDRGTKSDCFSEVNPSLNPEMPAALVELAFHDNEEDASFLKDPAYRRDSSRAMYRAIVRYFEGGTFLPEPPVGVSMVGMVVTWEDGEVGDLWGDAPTSWVVYRSEDGRAWDNGTEVSERRYTVSADFAFVRVAAKNAGGLSFPSEIVGGRRGEDVPVLIVGAFDRLDAGLLEWEDVPGLGEIVRMNLRRMNAADGIVAFGEAVEWPFDSAADEALPELSGYDVVIWATGEESTVDETFSEAQQQALAGYVAGGGKLFASGAEMLWDLDEKGSESDRAFAVTVLGATMESDDAETTVAIGEGVLDGITMTFGAVFPVEWPDVLASKRTVIARYESGGVAAVMGGGVATFGFPVESMEERGEVVMRVIEALVPDYLPPDTGTAVDTAGADSGQRERRAAGVADEGGCACGADPRRGRLLRFAMYAAALAALGRARRPGLSKPVRLRVSQFR